MQLVGGGADKSLLVWDVSAGVTLHTLTGHTASVSVVACSPLDCRLAASVAEDRSLKLWDLARGFCATSVACPKMANALTLSRDGNTAITGGMGGKCWEQQQVRGSRCGARGGGASGGKTGTAAAAGGQRGHLDGSVCLWDVRQCRAGSTRPVLEVRVHSSLVTCVAATPSDSLLLVGGKDSSIAVWDLRAQATQQLLKAQGFTVGTIGSGGKGRSALAMSPDSRWVSAGGADGHVYVWDLLGSSLDGGGVARGSGTGRADPGGASPRVTVLKHHKDAVVATAWGAGGGTLVSADKAGVVAMWSLFGLA
ncbi:WD40-repeat-containing domain protein [Haematococcus lacustris]